MKYHKRKPDMETESFRMWKTPKDSEEFKEIKEQSSISPKINYKGMELSLAGFSSVGKNGEVGFAYKFKHDEKTVLYYLNKKYEEEFKEVIEKLKEMAGDYTVQNVDEFLENLYQQKHSLEKL